MKKRVSQSIMALSLLTAITAVNMHGFSKKATGMGDVNVLSENKAEMTASSFAPRNTPLAIIVGLVVYQGVNAANLQFKEQQKAKADYYGTKWAVADQIGTPTLTMPNENILLAKLN